MKRIGTEAHDSGFFDTITCLQPKDLPIEYRLKHLFYLNRFTRGYGYWMWKSFVTKLLLTKIEYGDIICYADAGCKINREGKLRFNEYVSMLSQSAFSNLSFRTVHTEKKYSKGDIFEHFGVLDNASIKDSGQLYGTVFMIHKDANSIDLINEWYLICHNHKNLINDRKSKVMNDAEFIDHRHDQSIFSILRKLKGSIILSDELYFFNWDFNKKFPIHSRRLR